MQSWHPASPLEEKLFHALTNSDADELKNAMFGAELVLPVAPDERADTEQPNWPTFRAEGRTWIVAYTSVDSMRAGSNDALQHARTVTLPEIATGWPDHDWGLAVNPGLPVQLPLGPGAVARLAAPSLLEDRAAAPAARTPLMQKLLPHAEIREILTLGLSRISGYCHQVMDVEHINDPRILVEALGRTDDLERLTAADDAVNLLRWPAVGLELYENAIGGTDEASRAAVDGRLIEEPPFVGLGFAPGSHSPIREYKVHGVGLPHGAHVCELTTAGTVQIRAYFNADLDRWLLMPPGSSAEGNA